MANTIREVMQPDPVAIDARASLELAAQLMRDHSIGDVLVTEDDQVLGILTDRDIVVRAIADSKHPAATLAGECCSEEVQAVRADDPPQLAIEIMRRAAVRRLPVVSDERIVGIVSMGDLAVTEDPSSALADISAAPPNA
jgi:CBS domain-containing protein